MKELRCFSIGFAESRLVKKEGEGNTATETPEQVKPPDTRAALAALKKVIEEAPGRAQKPTGGLENIPLIGPFFTQKIPVIEGAWRFSDYGRYRAAENETVKVLEDFLKQAAEAYFSEEALKSDEGEALLKGLEQETEAKIRYAFQSGTVNANTPAESLKGIEDRLQELGNLDGSPGRIDVKDLAVLQARMRVFNGRENLVNLALSGATPQETQKSLEAARLMDPEIWQDTVELALNKLIQESQRIGNDEVMRSGVAAYETKILKLKEPAFYSGEDQALEKIRGYVKTRAAISTQQGLEAIQFFAREWNKGRWDALESIGNPGIRRGALEIASAVVATPSLAKGVYDKPVAEFMALDAEEQLERLKNPELRARLVEAITNNLAQYNDRKTKTEKDPKTLARLEAMNLLTHEAQWLMQKYAKRPELKNEGIDPSQELASATPGANPAPWGVGLEDLNDWQRMSGGSTPASLGFNMRDMSLFTGKLIAGFVVVTNIMNSVKSAGGIKNLLKHPDVLVKNPYIAGGAAAFYALKRVGEQPRIASYATMTEAERFSLSTGDTLRSMAGNKEVGYSPLRSFIEDSGEWKVMKNLDPQALEQLKKDAENRARTNKEENPVITQEDLKAALPAELQYALPAENKQNAELRYTFYSKLIDPQTNVDALRQECAAWVSGKN